MHWARQFSSAFLSFWAGYSGSGLRRSALFSTLCSVLSIFKPSTSFAALSHNICFVMPRINHHQKQTSLTRTPTSLPHSLAIHPWQFHKRHREALAAQPTASRQQMGARCNWYESEAREGLGWHLIWTASQTKQAATPPKPSQSSPNRPSYAAHPS